MTLNRVMRAIRNELKPALSITFFQSDLKVKTVSASWQGKVTHVDTGIRELTIKIRFRVKGNI